MLQSIRDGSIFGPWHGNLVNYYLGDVIEDGQIRYEEGLKAVSGYYELQRILKGLPGLQRSYPDAVKKLEAVADQLVTVVDEKRHLIRVHGIDIQIGGNPDVEEMLAIGEGIRRHDPWLVREIFSDRPGKKKTRIYFGPIDQWNKVGREIKDNFSITDLENFYGLFEDHEDQSLIFIRSYPFYKFQKISAEMIAHTTEHEMGHAIDYYVANRYEVENGPSRDGSVSVFSIDPICFQNLEFAYERELVQVYAPERLGEYERAFDISDTEVLREIIGAAKERAKEQDHGGKIDEPTLLRFTERQLVPHAFTTEREFFAGVAILYNHPEGRKILRCHMPVYYRFFSILERFSPRDIENSRLCIDMWKALSDPAYNRECSERPR
ncbi:MAG: hypothetical protein HYT76_00385 [Deltaproteobacteria bacterium]|nr:hypothetical protein [Deltaproteobacteria bacterium]